ncbi:hypothetical protein K469DRAFT_685301 [Zopfia rhizophila CBS 207.26]|uniref:Mid2 domain-containing protein n=1 Tax=Zopfia rhizophila CBS 207.26 TaxID=1314779 RepID=A0A6A6EBN9_9PEZI|nr:hypothetical protein K469DRAFT_685301 [Zopfia rhizophila CBS 207.26]
MSKATTSYYSFTFPAFTTATNLGPLTPTSFPSSCYTNLMDMNRDGLGPSGAWKTLGCAMSACCPSSSFYTEEWAWMTSYYSPGVCPSDYQSCAPPKQSGLMLTPREGEKIVFCCPNNCICPNDEDMPLIIPGGCGSRLTQSKEETVYTVLNNFQDQIPETTIPYKFEPGFTQELQIAYPIQIRFADTTSTKSASTAHSPSPGSKSPNLSTGAIIGIAFGGFFGLFAACLIVYLALRSRKRNATTSMPPAQSEAMNEPGYPYMEGSESIYGPASPFEYGQGSPGNIPRKPVRQAFWDNENTAPREMPSAANVAELPTSRQ